MADRVGGFRAERFLRLQLVIRLRKGVADAEGSEQLVDRGGAETREPRDAQCLPFTRLEREPDARREKPAVLHVAKTARVVEVPPLAAAAGGQREARREDQATVPDNRGVALGGGRAHDRRLDTRRGNRGLVEIRVRTARG